MAVTAQLTNVLLKISYFPLPQTNPLLQASEPLLKYKWGRNKKSGGKIKLEMNAIFFSDSNKEIITV